MPIYRIPGATCATRSESSDPGTNCLWRSASPGIMTEPPLSPGYSRGVLDYLYTPAVKEVVEIPVALAPGMSWDGFWRLVYDQTNEGIQRQANELVRRGAVTPVEAGALVESRNQLLLRMRSKLTPFGQLYSELLKPRSSLKSFETFLGEKGSIEAVLRSVGKTRAVVDQIAVFSRVAGPALIVIDVTLTAVVIQKAAPNDRARVAAKQIGGMVGGFGAGMAGMWAGCATAAALASPSLLIPIVGEVTTGGACLVGGMFAGLGFGWLGREAGELAGESLYQIVNEVTDFRWKNAG